MRFLDLDALRRTPAATDPFPYVVVPGFVSEAARADLAGDFPAVEQPGSFPVETLRLGSIFAAFLRELEGEEFRAAMSAKLAIDLEGRPTMVTVRGQARPSDGGIHADSKTKLVTVLIYMNETWETEGGRLRLLRSPDNLEDMVTEVPPDAGTLLAFQVTPHSWHGHASVSGPRRALQLNWVRDESVVRRERRRHGISAKMKRLLDFAR